MRTTKTNPRIVPFVKRLTIGISFLFVPSGLLGQVADDFSDGDFSFNPVWMGDTADFTVTASSALPPEVAPSLRLQAENSDTSILVVSATFGDQTEWRFLVKLSFNTSSSNFARVYLAADHPNLKGPLNGICLQLGGADDSLKLFRQQGLEHTLLLTGQQSYTGSSSNLFRLKVTRDAQGTWKLYSDPEGGCAFIEEGSGFDPEPLTGPYFGFFCRYTSSNASKFYFDDVYLTDLYADTSGPVVDSVQTPADSILRLYFSESLDFVSAQDTGNYFMDCGIGFPVLAKWDPDAKNRVTLELKNTLPAGELCYLQLEKVRDLSGNSMIPVSIPVLYSPPEFARPYDLVINEVMADVNPAPPDLPAAEYIELYNRTGLPFGLEGYAVKPRENGTWLELSNVLLPAGGYLIVTATADSGSFSPFGKTVGLSGFSLNNEGVVVLRNPEGTVLHRLEYTNLWYADEEKKQGGWSLEQIDPECPCPGEENWSVSVHPAGGTPGSVNSTDAVNPVPLNIKALTIENDTALQVRFNQVVSDSMAALPQFYSVHPGPVFPVGVSIADSGGTSYRLMFHPPLLKGKLYKLEILPGLLNCVGVAMPAPERVTFGIPETPEWNDLVINELLFNPVGDGVDFVELYNRSQKIVDPSTLQLGEIDVDAFGMPDTTFRKVDPSHPLILPGDLVVLTKDPDRVMEQYTSGDPGRFIRLDPFPSMPNEEGNVVLATRSGTIVDVVSYSADLHHPLLISSEGVSLERIHFDRPSSDPDNWHSASSVSGFATPALPNSQFTGNIHPEDEVTVVPEIFSPDNDGRDDVTQICYRFAEPGSIAKILVYDVRGRPVRFLANNEMLDREGSILWDGTMETGEKAAIGIYLVYLEVLHQGGTVKKFKRSVVVAGYLR